MKKESLILILLLLIPFSTAIEIHFKDNQTYNPLETIVATIEGNIITPITEDNIYFYEGRTQTPITDFGIAKMRDKYYIYIVLPNKIRNYTMVIEDVHYFEAAQDHIANLQADIKVDGEPADFTITPGIVTTEKDIEISATSNFDALILTSAILNHSKTTEIPAGQTKPIKFSVETVDEQTLTDLIISSELKTYEVPILIIPTKQNKTTNLTNQTDINETRFRFSPDQLSINITTNYPAKLSISLINDGETDIEDLNLSVEDSLAEILNLDPDITNLAVNETIEVNLTLFSISDGVYTGRIIAETDEGISYLDLEVYSNLPEDNQSIPITQVTCAELSGTFCSYDQICDGFEQTTIEGTCCIGTCQQSSGGGSGESNWTKWVIIIIIIIALGVIGFFVFKKIKSRKEIDKLKEKSNKFQDRFRSPTKATQARGALSRE